MEGRTKEIRDEFWIWDKIWVWDEVWNDGKMRILRGKGGNKIKVFYSRNRDQTKEGYFLLYYPHPLDEMCVQEVKVKTKGIDLDEKGPVEFIYQDKDKIKIIGFTKYDDDLYEMYTETLNNNDLPYACDTAYDVALLRIHGKLFFIKRG